MRILIAVFIFSLVLLQASASALVFDFGKIWGQAADNLNEKLATCELNTGMRILVTSGIPTTQQNANDLFQGSSMATQGMPSKNLLLMYSDADKRFFAAPAGHPLAAELTEAKLKEDVTSLVEFVINNLCGVTIIQPAKTCTSNADCPSGVCTGGVCQAQPPEGECNKDGKCDPGENYKSCKEDCPSGGEDGYCDGVKDGKCDPDCTSPSQDEDCATGNQKDMTKYTAGTVFLVSDQDWKSVMGLMSVAMWKSDGQSCNDGNRPGKCLYPLLIYHKESDTVYDADSILHFLDQYSASRIVSVGALPWADLAATKRPGIQIDTMTTNDYLSFWEQRKLIVVSEPDYSTAMLASVYAAKNNAPLIFSDDPNLNNIIGTDITDVVTVGNVDLGDAQPKSVTKKQLSEIQPASDKVILTIPSDVSGGCITNLDYLNDEQTTLHSIYCKDSLAAPVLAFAKDERIALDKDSVYSYSSANNINYITILASPRFFPQGAPPSNDEGLASKANNGQGADYWGRVYGVTPSDTSSYVARSIFFTDSGNRLKRTASKALLLSTGFNGYVTPLASLVKQYIPGTTCDGMQGVNPYCDQLSSVCSGCNDILKLDCSAYNNFYEQNKQVVTSEIELLLCQSTVGGLPNSFYTKCDDPTTPEPDRQNACKIIQMCNTFDTFCSGNKEQCDKCPIRSQCVETTDKCSNFEETCRSGVTDETCSGDAGALQEEGQLGQQDIIYYDGHSVYYEWWATIFRSDANNRPEVPYLDLTFGIAASCNTNNFNLVGTPYTPVHPESPETAGVALESDYLLGAEFMRRGGIGYIGAIDLARIEDGMTINSGFGEDMMLYLLKTNGQIGRILHDTYKSDPYGGIAGTQYHPFVLYGDPTVELNMNTAAIPNSAVTYHSGIDVYKNLQPGQDIKLNIYTQPLLGKGAQTASGIKIKIPGGSDIENINFGSCVQDNYKDVGAAQNTPGLQKCTVEFNAPTTTGLYTCDVQGGGYTLSCPFNFAVI